MDDVVAMADQDLAVTVRASTRTAYRYEWKAVRRLIPGSTLVAHIDRALVVNALERDLGSGIAHETRRKHFVALNRLLALAVARGALPSNPMEGLRAPTEPRSPPRFLARDERQRLLDSAKARGVDYHLLVWHAGYTWVCGRRSYWPWKNVQQKMAGVAFQGNLAVAYTACLWSRTASRILLLLGNFTVQSQQDLYNGVQSIDWSEHLDPDNTLAVSFNSKNNAAINNTLFGVQKVKDAIVDQMRATFGVRPNIDTECPDIRVNVYLHNDTAQLSLDLSGESSHKRGYRDINIVAPIKENLAAAILLRAGWPEIAAQGGSLLDPMCGSATLLIEGAFIAGDIAPGLQRDYFGFLGWKQHSTALWQTILGEAEQRRQAGLTKLPMIVGFDQDRRTVSAALQHVDNAGLSGKIHIEKRCIADACAKESWPKGLIVCNPPYGERLGDEEQTSALYRQFGEIMKQRFSGWQAALIIANPELGFRLGIRSQKPVTLFNGALECKLLRLSIEPEAFFEPKIKSPQERIEQISRSAQSGQSDNQSDMFANRLRKNLKKLSNWVKKNDVHCYRLYDADLPEYAVAVDIYQGEQPGSTFRNTKHPKQSIP